MEVITIESKAFKQLMEKLDVLSDYICSVERPGGEKDEESWVDSQEVCRFLKISERTLQRLRSNGKITYSCMGGKYYYLISEIKRLLKERVIKSTDECMCELMEHYKRENNAKK